MGYPKDGANWIADFVRREQPKPADLATDVLDALTRKLRDYDRLAAALTSAQAEATKQTERARKAEADYANVARRGSRAVSQVVTLEDMFAVGFDGDVVGAVRKLRKELAKARKNFDEVTQQRDETGRKLYEAHQERDRLRKELDALRANAKPTRDMRSHLLAALDVVLRRVAFDEAHWTDLRDLRDDVRDGQPWQELAGRAEGRATAAPEFEPPLSPLVLIETITNAHGRKQTAYYDGDISLTWRRTDGLVSEWTLVMGETTTFGADGACRTDDALGDVNAMLARYGYVLEAWP